MQSSFEYTHNLFQISHIYRHQYTLHITPHLLLIFFFLLFSALFLLVLVCIFYNYHLQLFPQDKFRNNQYKNFYYKILLFLFPLYVFSLPFNSFLHLSQKHLFIILHHLLNLLKLLQPYHRIYYIYFCFFVFANACCKIFYVQMLAIFTFNQFNTSSPFNNCLSHVGS